MTAAPYEMNESPIDIASMPHEVHIRRQEEDWAGITDPKERKKLQNRLNQRARRQRKARSPEAKALVRQGDFVPSRADVLFTDVTEENIHQLRANLQRFASQAAKSFAGCQPHADHLLCLIQLNVINSLTRNSNILGLPVDWLVCSSLSPFGLPQEDASAKPVTIDFSSLPANMVPTRLQQRVPHHPWLDLLPLPRMRDNFLIALSQVLTHDEEQHLWDDLIESGGEKKWTGMIAWGEPWVPASWEVTLPFLRRWGWLLQGCDEVIESTNHWRRKRGLRSIGRNEWWKPEEEMCLTQVRQHPCECGYHLKMAALSRKALENRVD